MKRFGIILVACMLFILPGCGKEEKDPTKEEIIKISITPMPSPTPAPGELAPEAVVREGDLTMVNEYLAGQIESVPEANEAEGGILADDETTDDAAEETVEETAEEDVQ